MPVRLFTLSGGTIDLWAGPPGLGQFFRGYDPTHQRTLRIGSNSSVMVERVGYGTESDGYAVTPFEATTITPLTDAAPPTYDYSFVGLMASAEKEMLDGFGMFGFQNFLGDSGRSQAWYDVNTGVGSTGLLYDPGTITNWWDAVDQTLTANATASIAFVADACLNNGMPHPSFIWPVHDGKDYDIISTTSANYFTFSTNTTDSDPGAGNFKFDNAGLGSVAHIYISNTNSVSTDVSTWINTALTAKRFYVTNILGTTHQLILSVTRAVVDGGTYKKIPVSLISGSVLPTNLAL
jgi:hypothetical protein